jgi:hypothetical protein
MNLIECGLDEATSASTGGGIAHVLQFRTNTIEYRIVFTKMKLSMALIFRLILLFIGLSLNVELIGNRI